MSSTSAMAAVVSDNDEGLVSDKQEEKEISSTFEKNVLLRDASMVMAVESVPSSNRMHHSFCSNDQHETSNRDKSGSDVAQVSLSAFDTKKTVEKRDLQSFDMSFVMPQEPVIGCVTKQCCGDFDDETGCKMSGSRQSGICVAYQEIEGKESAADAKAVSLNLVPPPGAVSVHGPRFSSTGESDEENYTYHNENDVLRRIDMVCATPVGDAFVVEDRSRAKSLLYEYRYPFTLVVIVLLSVILVVVVGHKKPQSTTLGSRKTNLTQILADLSSAVFVEGSPQNMALMWILGEDNTNLGTDGNTQSIVQRYVLAVVYYSTNGGHWGNHNFLSSFDECRWNVTLVKCDGAVLTEINLDSNGLSGKIPSDIQFLKNLRVLAFENNTLSGTIPGKLGSLQDLQWLKAGGNALNGKIPSTLGNMTSLTVLSLQRNALTGPIPTELHGAKSLDYLDLSSNHLVGSIPSEIGNATGLTHLYLSENSLTGSIPGEIGSLSDLVVLDLSSNSLKGSIPSELGKLVHLEEVNLSENILSGPIPTELGHLKKLQNFNATDNNLSGDASFLCSLPSVQDISVDKNNVVCSCC